MRYAITALCLATLCAVGQADAQTAPRPERRRAVLLPMEIATPVVVSQPDCPLQYEGARLMKYTEGYLAGLVGKSYQLRNRGSKPIRSYDIAYLTTAGGSETGWAAPLDSKLLMPGEARPLPGEGHEVEIIPLTEELRDKLKLRGPTEGIIFFMVVRVEFDDGTIYSAEREYKALEAYLEGVGAKLSRY